ncbi:hypothetical protein ACFV0Z_08845 [Streptomyces xiamenensis]|uniref:hypothetical protein n=1 Tax=Streptomyces xiamenensis TaxID=408015 RepID=UPI0036C4FAC4
MKIEDLLLKTDIDGLSSESFFAAQDSLQEAELIGIRADAIFSKVGVLFDMRTSLQMRNVDAVLVSAYSLVDMKYSPSHRVARRSAWPVMSSKLAQSEDIFLFDCTFSPELDLHLRAYSISFHALRIPGLPSVPPDYVEGSDEKIIDENPGWGSGAELIFSESYG